MDVRPLTLLTVLLAPLPLLGPRAVDDGEPEFVEALEDVARLCERERWKSAREHLLEALEEHARQPYVLERADEIRGVMANCDFWLANERPEPEDVVGGKLLSYNERKGEIHIVYEAPEDEEHLVSPPDFEERDGLLVHPAVFSAKSSLEVRGDGIRQLEPDLRTCITDEGYISAVYDMGGSSRLWREEDGERTLLDDCTDFENVNRPYVLRLDLAEKNVSAYLNGKRYLRGDKPKELAGRFGYASCAEVKRVTLKGSVDPAWIEGLVAARIAELRAAFDETYDPAASLPDWLVP
jgi:hypothetical protein